MKGKDSEYSITIVNDTRMFEGGCNAGSHNLIFMGEGKVIMESRKKGKVSHSFSIIF